MLALTILGNNSAIPAFGRHPTAQVITTTNELLLVDCGEGTQMQLAKYKIRRSKISCIFISHLHGDHYFGLIGLLTSFSLGKRVEPIRLFGPAALMQIIQLQLDVADIVLSYELIFTPLFTEDLIYSGKKLEVHCFKVNHRIECWGFKFTEIKNKRKIDVEACKQMEIPRAFYPKLQQGEDYITKQGKHVKNEIVTLPGDAPKSYAYCADTAFEPSIIPHIAGVTLLYHESTYLGGLEKLAQERQHSTSRQAAEMAQMAKADKLLLGHFSSRYDTIDEFAEDATRVFTNTECSKEGVSYIL